MAKARRWETTLGEVGGLLDTQEAHHIKIIDEPRCVAVWWQAGFAADPQRCFVGVDPLPLAPLGPRRSEESGWSVLLGALGHEIDRQRIDVACIEEAHGGLLLSGSRAGKHLKRHFKFMELQDAAESLFQEDWESPTSRRRGNFATGWLRLLGRKSA